MSTMKGDVGAALIDAGAHDEKYRKAARSVVPYGSDIAETNVRPSPLEWMVGFTFALVFAMTGRAFS